MVKLSVDKNASFLFFCLKQEASICNVHNFIILSNMFYNLKINPLYLSLYFNKRDKFLRVWIFLIKTIFMNSLLAQKSAVAVEIFICNGFWMIVLLKTLYAAVFAYCVICRIQFMYLEKAIFFKIGMLCRTYDRVILSNGSIYRTCTCDLL